jgi:Flp pilus assembly protein protease CpaA
MRARHPGAGTPAPPVRYGGPVHGTDLAWGALLAVLAAATVCDVRSRRVPAWLTGGGVVAGVLLAAWAGPPALLGSLLGAVVGGVVFLPFVWRGWLGGADALLLAAVGAWQGWRVALLTAWWTALAGAALALAVWGWRRWRARRVPRPPDAPSPRRAGAGAARSEPFPYVPAILAGAVLALLAAT